MVDKDETVLDALAAQEARPAEKADTPEIFLDNLSETLKASDGVDDDLATVLAEHLLTIAPQTNAVANATSAIVAIAAKRAAPAGENTGG